MGDARRGPHRLWPTLTGCLPGRWPLAFPRRLATVSALQCEVRGFEPLGRIARCDATVPSPPEKHIFENFTIQAHPKTAGKNKYWVPVGRSTRTRARLHPEECEELDALEPLAQLRPPRDEVPRPTPAARIWMSEGFTRVGVWSS